jgi:hypothetical protein
MNRPHTAETDMPATKQAEGFQSETIDTGYLRITLKEAWAGDGYRLSHSRMRTPTADGGETWVPNRSWDLPKGRLTAWEVQEMLAAFDRSARRRYQLKKQKQACRRRKRERWHKAHEEPDLDIETEHVRTASGIRTLNRIKS